MQTNHLNTINHDVMVFDGDKTRMIGLPYGEKKL